MLAKLSEREFAAVTQHYDTHDITMSKEFQFITKHKIDNTIVMSEKKFDGNVCE